MEKDFYTDDFEQLLKDTTDDFRMYPSRKVWHSIYNDLHPARKWPSFAVCLLLITSILYVGVHNNNTINADADNLMLATLSPADNTEKDDLAGITSSVNKDKTGAPEFDDYHSLSLQKNKKEKPFVNLSLNTIVAYKILPANKNIMTGDIETGSPAGTLPGFVKEAKIITPLINLSAADLSSTMISEPVNETAINDLEVQEPMTMNPDTRITVTPDLAANPTIETKTPALKTQPVSAIKGRNADETSWMEDYAFHNKRNSNKWKTKLSTVVYFTPSVGYRIMNKNNNFEPVNALLIRSSATSVDADDAISQQAALNMESGASVLLDLTRRLKVKTGFQISYTNYISYAQKLSHPTQTNVLLNDLNTGNTLLVPFSTMYGNKAGDNLTRLNNKTIQFSIPIGADFKLAGNDKLNWYIGATIQPTYVAGGNAYLVSSDYKNYIDMPSMLRTWNLNAGFESFISYKTKSGSYLNLGPQFRYQLMSTYSNRYTYTENLYNIGIKVGIMRKL